MTPYSTSPDNSIKPTIHPEVDATDWESEMAKLVGLAPESVTEEVPITAKESSPQPPAEVKTEQPLAANPFAKLALVGTGTLAVIVVAGGFLTQIMGSNSQKPKRNQTTSPQIQSPATNITPPENLSQQVETLKTKLALAEQAQAVKLAQQNLRNEVRAIAPQPPQTHSTSTQRTISNPTPRTVIVERVATNPYSYPQAPVVNQLTPQIPPPPTSIPSTPPTPNPWQEWSRLSKLGSYGQVEASNQPGVTYTNPTPPENNYAPPQGMGRNSYQTSEPPSSLISQASSRSPQSLKVGTSVKAVLATAVFGETTRSRGSDENSNQNQFVVRLQQPLKGVDGTVALAANTELLTQVDSISEQGVIQLKVVKAMISDNGNLSERDLPANALTIRGSGGKPLLAKQYPDRSSSIAGMDTGLFVLGGVAKAAELFNRTESQVVTSTGGGTVVSTSNPRRNLGAGILEGGLNSVVPQISQRNQQAIAQMMQQTNVWFLAAGTEVEIYVNQGIQL